MILCCSFEIGAKAAPAVAAEAAAAALEVNSESDEISLSLM